MLFFGVFFSNILLNCLLVNVFEVCLVSEVLLKTRPNFHCQYVNDIYPVNAGECNVRRLLPTCRHFCILAGLAAK